MKNKFLMFSLFAILFASCGANNANSNASEESKNSALEVNWNRPMLQTTINGDTLFVYKLDSKDNIIEIKCAESTIKFEYDENNRLIKESNDCEWDAYIYDYVYDNQGRLIELNTNIGTNSTYTYQDNKQIIHTTGMREGMEEVDEYTVRYCLDKEFKKDTLELFFEKSYSDESSFDRKYVTKYNDEGLKTSVTFINQEYTLIYKDNTCTNPAEKVITYYEYK